MRSHLRLLTTLLLAAHAGGALAVNTGFLRSTPAARFNADDFDKLRAAFVKAMDDGENAATVEWRNPATGSSGAITPHDRFERDGRVCRHATVQIAHRRRQVERGQLFCRGEDGQGWQLMP
jgi:surface antigen